MITAHTHPQRIVHLSSGRGVLGLFFSPVDLDPLLALLGFCRQMLNMPWAKGQGVSAKQFQRHLQTTVIEDISQKVFRVQISLIKMGKARVREMRGAWLRAEGGGGWREEREGGKVINILQVFSNTARLTPSGKCHLMDYILGWKVRLIQCNEGWMGLQALIQPQETPYKRVCSFSH